MPRRFLLLEHPLQHGAHHEPLGAVVQAVDVDDRGLGLAPVEPVLLAAAHVLAADQVADVPSGGRQAPLEGRHRAGRGEPRPLLGAGAILAVGAAVGQHLDQVVERLDTLAVDRDPGVGGLALGRGGLVQLGLDAVEDEAELARGVVGLGEQEPQQPLLHELAQRPEESGDALLAAPGVGQPLARALAYRGHDLHALEGGHGQAELRVLGPRLGVEATVGLVDEQQVLALDVEDDAVRVGGPAPERAAREEAVEQERRVGGLGGDARRCRRC